MQILHMLCNMHGSALTGLRALCGAGVQPQQQQATHQTSGIPPLVHSAVLTDRRHILSKDAEGNVELWDIATGAVEQRFGKVGCHLALCANHSINCNGYRTVQQLHTLVLP